MFVARGEILTWAGVWGGARLGEGEGGGFEVSFDTSKDCGRRGYLWGRGRRRVDGVPSRGKRTRILTRLWRRRHRVMAAA